VFTLEPLGFGKERVTMKRAPLFYPRVFHDPETARSYAASASSRGQRVGKATVEILAKSGFEKGRILDAGCGAGDVALELARGIPGAEVVGLDLSEPMLELARSSAAQAGLTDRLCFEKGDIQKMPFQDGWFDVVVSLNTLHVVEDPVAMINEVERVLAPEGGFALSDIKRSWIAWVMPMLRTAYTPAEVEDILRRSRLRSWQVSSHFFWLLIEAHAPGKFLPRR
jgi:ubiquinone/menaquinone biosynthesis C-methylase UbiE